MKASEVKTYQDIVKFLEFEGTELEEAIHGANVFHKFLEVDEEAQKTIEKLVLDLWKEIAWQFIEEEEEENKCKFSTVPMFHTFAYDYGEYLKLDDKKAIQLYVGVYQEFEPNTYVEGISFS